MSEEPRYTKAEWQQIQTNNSMIRSVSNALRGYRIRDMETFKKILFELWAVCEDSEISFILKNIMEEVEMKNNE